MTEFFRFPSTPHLTWLGSGVVRDEKVLDVRQVERLLSGPVHVEEKLDGANLGFSLSSSGRLQAQNRGAYLTTPRVGQFARLDGWLLTRAKLLEESLGPHLVAFGEWCAARHSVAYDKLPDWWLLFDVFDRQMQQFVSVERRNAFALAVGVPVVPKIAEGSMDLPELVRLAEETPSRFGPHMAEGLVVRRDEGDWNVGRAKIVRSTFSQPIVTHWRNRRIEWNQLGQCF